MYLITGLVTRPPPVNVRQRWPPQGHMATVNARSYELLGGISLDQYLSTSRGDGCAHGGGQRRRSTAGDSGC